MKLPTIKYTEGTLEALKWLAALTMTLDHINKYLLNGQFELLFSLGRLSLPVFIAALVYSLAQPGAYESGVYERVMKRLSIAAVLATPLVLFLNPSLTLGWWPLNIMFTLLVLTATIYFNNKQTATGYVVAPVLLIAAGFVVEFWWPALIFGVCAYSYMKRPSVWSVFVAAIMLMSLWIINKNLWALAAIPVLWGATKINVNLTRIRHFFYWYYPLHLTALVVLRLALENYGFKFNT